MRALAAELAGVLLCPDEAEAHRGLCAEPDTHAVAAAAERLDAHVATVLQNDRRGRAKELSKGGGGGGSGGDGSSGGGGRSSGGGGGEGIGAGLAGLFGRGCDGSKLHERLQRAMYRDAVLALMLSLTQHLTTALRTPPAAAAPLSSDLSAFVPLVKTWPTPLGGSCHLQALIEPLKFASAFAIGALWLAVDQLYTSSHGRGLWIPLTICFVASSNTGDAIGQIQDRIISQVHAPVCLTAWCQARVTPPAVSNHLMCSS